MKVLTGLCFFLEVLGEGLFPYLLQLQEAAHIPCLTAPFFHCQSQECDLESLSRCTLSGSDLLFHLPLPLLWTLIIILDPPR